MPGRHSAAPDDPAPSAIPYRRPGGGAPGSGGYHPSPPASGLSPDVPVPAAAGADPGGRRGPAGGHGHGHGAGVRLGPGGVRLLAMLLVPLAVATVAGLLLLWPAHRNYPVPIQFSGPDGGRPRFVTGRVDVVEDRPCASDRSLRCAGASVRLDSGPDAGTFTTLETGQGPGAVRLTGGERVRLAVGTDPRTGTATYTFVDIVRTLPLGLVALLFVVAVVAVARWRGLAALLGLGVSYAVLALFVLPALLAGESPLLVGLVAGSTILFAVLYLAHGPSARTSIALLGTLISLVLAAVLAAVFTASAHLTGLSSDAAVALQTAAPQVSFTGLILCGVVIGALGVLNDVTVTQAAAVWELRAADPTARAGRLYRAAMRIGRDHIASSVYTLVLAYAGSALPLLLLVSLAQQPLGDVLTSDEIGTELLRGLIGGAALAASVPITTALAAWFAARAGTVGADRHLPPGRGGSVG